MSDALRDFVRRLRAFDCETHRFRIGLNAPPLVCASTATPEPGSERLLLGNDARNTFSNILNHDEILVGANIYYDCIVMMADDLSIIPAVFEKFERGEVFDVQTAEQLNAIAGGHLGKMPGGGPLVHPGSGAHAKRYNLDIVTALNLGRFDAKKHDFWRKRYALLENVPLSDWPEDARRYPLDDVRNTVDVAVVQACGRSDPPAPGHRNLHCMPDQTRAGLVLALSAAWGFRTNRTAVDALRARVAKSRESEAVRWYEAGFMLEGEGKGGNDKKAGALVKQRLARAHGAERACTVCGGTGKIRNAKGKTWINCTDKNLGSLPAERAEAGGRGCDGTGLDLSASVTLSRTELGGVQAGRDFLADSGDDELMAFAKYQEDEKLSTVYIPFLEQGTEHALTLSVNLLLENGRVSYDDVVQQLPRDMGVRECIEAREGYVFCSCDYSSGELCTFGQVALWVVGYSDMADIINATKNPGALHLETAAAILGISSEEARTRYAAKERAVSDARQASKPVNFGLLGGMGEARLVIGNRKASVGRTYSPYGTCVDDKGARYYIGIRFCILVGGRERCGDEKVVEWKKRSIPPTCRHCLETARDIKAAWLRRYSEAPKYFKWIANRVDADGELVQFVSERVRGGLSFTDGANTLFSGLLADGAKRALWYIGREMYVEKWKSPLYGSRVTMFQHDETFAELRDDVRSEAGKRQAALMVEGLKEYVPDVHVDCQPALMRRWSKKAEPVWRDDVTGGELLVWELKA